MMDEFKKYYDRFVNHYNDSNLTAFSELVSMQSGIQRHYDRLEMLIDKQIDQFDQALTNLCDGAPLTLPMMPDVMKGVIEKRKPLYKKKDDIVEQVKSSVYWRTHQWDPELFIETITRPVSKLCDELGDDRVGQVMIHMHNIVNDGRRRQGALQHLNAVTAVISKIIDKGFPEELPLYQMLPAGEQKEIKKDNYEPHHNTRAGLVKDLTKIINEIEGKKRYFHSDGRIKPTAVATYAVEQKWFRDKHGDGERGLHEHIKGIHASMNST